MFQQLCEEITLVSERIAALEAEVEELKAGLRPVNEEADVEVTFEEVVAETEAEYCCEEQAAGTCCCEEAPVAEAPAEEAPAAEEPQE